MPRRQGTARNSRPRSNATTADRSGEESNTDEEEQIADRNQTGAGEREDFSDLDPRQVQDQGTSDW